MPSPFPGMDPYLERHWLDVHTKLVAYAADEMNRRLPPDLIARVEERMAIEAEQDEPSGEPVRRRLAPDVRVFEAVESLAVAGAAAGGGGVALAPYRLVLADEPIVERYIEIIDVRGGEQVVTVVEFVSPTNKAGRGLGAFVDKRNALLDGGVNFVEVDLVRAGDWSRLLDPHACPARARSAYRAVIRIPSDPAAAYLHPIGLREPLPSLKVPLRPSDAPCDLPLQPLLDQAYLNGRYERTVDYKRAVVPPLDGADAAWADELLRGAGRR